MNIIITGIAGFAGKHLLKNIAAGDEVTSRFLKKEKALLTGSNRVLGMDLKINSTAERELKNIFTKIDLSEVNIKDKNKVDRIIEKFNPDQIYHLAAQSSVSYSWENPVETIESNVIGGINILEAVKKYCPLCRILVACTAEEYEECADGLDEPVNESFKIQPKNPYAISKAALDFFASTYHAISGLFVYISRSFNHTGPGQSDRFVASDFAKQIAEIEKGLKDPVIYVGNVEVYRDFLDVRDVVQAYKVILEKGRAGEAYNVCSGIKIKISDILDILISYSSIKNIKIRVDENKIRPTDIISIYGDNSKLKLHTGWEPVYDLKESLKDTLEWWRERS